MGQRRNENWSMVRSEPFAYRAAYDASSNVEYEGWSQPGAADAGAVWLICKHTYSSGNLTETKWAATTGSPAAEFDQVWNNRTSLTYV